MTKMSKAVYRGIELKHLTSNQHILYHGVFGDLYKVLPCDRYISFHEWAGLLKTFYDQYNMPMIDENTFGFRALRLIEEGMVEMSNEGPCDCDDCDCDEVVINVMPLADGAKLPALMTGGAAGADVYATKDISIGPGQTVLVPLSIAVEIPPGYEIQCRARSGLSAKGIIVANSPGTIDSDYRGECKVILHNLNETPFEIKAGDRVAQFVASPVLKVRYQWKQELSETERGSGGFGSTGSR